MKFSILVPVYNVEKYLEQCVDSLLNQTYTGEYEIILVDDGSTDSSGAICDRYQKNNPDKIRVVHKKNEGLVSARQAGIELATGEYSLFVDSDDFAELNLFETVNGCIERNDNPDMVIYSYRYFTENKKKERKIALPDNGVYYGESKKTIYNHLLVSTSVTPIWAKALKTEILKNDPTDYSLYYDKNMGEDLFRSVHIVTAAEEIVYINSPLYCYRTNEDSISRSFRPETIANKNMIYVYNRIREYMPLWGMDNEENINKLNARWFNETMHTFGKYYEYASSKDDKKKILNYNWGSMIPEVALNFSDNPYISKLFCSFFNSLKSKYHIYIHVFFGQKRLYKKLRNLKSRLLNK